MTAPTCSINNDECSKLGGPITRGMCQKHYTRWKRHGDAGVVKQIHRGPTSCSIWTLARLGEKFNVDQAVVGRVISRRIWSHVDAAA
jgi:hypothetical protein